MSRNAHLYFTYYNPFGQVVNSSDSAKIQKIKGEQFKREIMYRQFN